MVGGKELDILTSPSTRPAIVRQVPRSLREGVLAKNDLLAEGLRARYAASGVRVSNWVSSPGQARRPCLRPCWPRRWPAGWALPASLATAPPTMTPSASPDPAPSPAKSSPTECATSSHR